MNRDGMSREMTKDVDRSAPASWEAEADAVVVGYGAAGAAAAIAAHDAGAKVLILEKAPERYRGGSSRVSENGVFFPTDVEKAIVYFNAMARPYRDNISEEMVRVWAEEMYNNRAWLQRFNQLKHVSNIFPVEKI